MKKSLRSLILAGVAALTLGCTSYAVHLDNQFKEDQARDNLEFEERRLLEDHASVEVINSSRDARGNIYIIKQIHADPVTGKIDSLAALVQSEIYRIADKLYNKRGVRKFYKEGLLPGEGKVIENNYATIASSLNHEYADNDDEFVYSMIYRIINEADPGFGPLVLLDMRHSDVEIKGSENEVIRRSLTRFYDYLDSAQVRLRKWGNEIEEFGELRSVIEKMHYTRSYNALEACMKDVYYYSIDGSKVNVAMVMGGSHEQHFRQLCETGELGKYNIILVTPLSYKL